MISSPTMQALPTALRVALLSMALAGPFAAAAEPPGTRYSCDTEGGNSGSPVIERATGCVLALHNSAGTQCVNQGHSFESIEPRIRELLR